ncbi:MAG TPA: Gfo/Idh/MocA family oxidoreductase [Fimbriimonas sp.]|nr:Gfo/Idh/MocA family oxidoreductase [Fimbriimonas sp.]
MSRIVCIGAGGIMRNAHLPAYQTAGFDVVALIDTNLASAKELAEKFDIAHVSADLADVPSGAIYDVATPPSTYVEILSELPDESYCLIQKPLGETYSQALDVLEVCEKKGHRSAANFQLRWCPYVVAMKQAIAAGEIGELVDVDFRVNVHTPWAGWPFLEQSPRMEIVYHSIHYIDLIRDLLGEPSNVWARAIKHPDSPKLESSRSSIYLDYGDWLRGTIQTYHAHKAGAKYQESSIKVEGTKGCIRIQMGLNLNYPVGGADLCEIWRDGDSGWTPLAFSGSWIPDAFVGPMQAMLDWKSSGVFPVTEIHDAMKTMELVERAYAASDQMSV